MPYIPSIFIIEHILMHFQQWSYVEHKCIPPAPSFEDWMHPWASIFLILSLKNLKLILWAYRAMCSLVVSLVSMFGWGTTIALLDPLPPVVCWFEPHAWPPICLVDLGNSLISSEIKIKFLKTLTSWWQNEILINTDCQIAMESHYITWSIYGIISLHTHTVHISSSNHVLHIDK